MKLLMSERKNTQIEAAEMGDMKRPGLSKHRLEPLKLVSVEKPILMLTTFDQDVEITVKPRSRRDKTGGIIFVPTA